MSESPGELVGSAPEPPAFRRGVDSGRRFLRVVVNPHVTPKRVVTVFFDRRLRTQS